MKIPRIIFFLAALFAMFVAPIARGDDFESHLDLSPLRTIAVNENQTVKTLDSFARQVMTQITGHGSFEGHDAIFTLMDMSFRPEDYVNRNMIKIANVPIRQAFLELASIDSTEQDRIVKQGTVSLTFLQRQDVADLLERVQSTSVNKSNAIDQVMNARMAMEEICQVERGFIPAAIIAPPASAEAGAPWHRLTQMIGDVPVLVSRLEENGAQKPEVIPGYEGQSELLFNLFTADGSMMRGWENGDADLVNRSSVELANLLTQVNPQAYPSPARQKAEVIYNRLFKLTIPGAAFYFIAFVLFLMSATAGVGRLRLWGLRFMAIALLIHSTGIGIRWWLVGGIFPPIKNEFESVMFSAWFGAVVGMILELRKSRGMFGAAASFIGLLSLVAIFSAPYVTGREIGGEIGQVQGILMSYWLYIHVTMVTAAYALIGMGFVLSAWWLIRYYKEERNLRNVPGNLISSDAAPAMELSGVSGGAISLGFAQTLATMLFVRRAPKVVAIAQPTAARTFLATLDQCNLVVLQLAFWVLGAGVICGAIWADQSWGRPWGWDPKETFALVTWIVYLIVVHVRIVTIDKAWWTAVLSCIGFFIMLFNWIGVNFLLVGLHSYA